MTQSLLSAWNYMYSCHEEQGESALAGFTRALNRERSEPNEAMQAGIDFEREVYAQMRGDVRAPHKKWEAGIQAVATIIDGSVTQVRLSKKVKIDGLWFILYGVIDALKAGVIYDVKFSTKKFHSVEVYGKYLSSAQHPMYLAIVPEAREFIYVVSDGEDVYTEVYRRTDIKPIEETISQFMASIEAMGLLPIYLDKWTAS
jgi:hypothetical protein